MVICTRVSEWSEAVPTLWATFPSLFNAYTLSRSAVPRRSLQKVLASTPMAVNLPEVWVDPDGVKDLAKPATRRLLSSVLFG